MGRRQYADQGLAVMQGYRMGAQAVRDFKDDSNKAELADAMKNATTEEKSTVAEVNAPDAANYTKDSETGNYAPSLAAIQGGVSETLKPIQEPQYESKTERVDKTFATPADKRSAMLQAGIDFWAKKGETDKVLELEDKLEQQSLRKLQVKGAERADRTAQKEEDYEKSKVELSKNFSGNRMRVENEQAMGQYNKQLSDYQEALKSNPDAAGQPPPKPSLRVMTGVDMLHDATMMMLHDMEHGKVDPVKALQYQQMVGQVKKEVGVEAFKLLHAGDIQGAIKSFESQGDLRLPQGATVEARKGVYETAGQKVPTNELVVKLPNGHIQVINGLQGMDALDAADKVVSRAFQGAELANKNKELGIQSSGLKIRQDEAGRAGERWKIEKPELEAKADETKNQRTARKGVVDAVESGDPKRIEAAMQKAIAAGVKYDKPKSNIKVIANPQGGYAVFDEDAKTGSIYNQDAVRIGNIERPGSPLQAPPEISKRIDGQVYETPTGAMTWRKKEGKWEPKK